MRDSTNTWREIASSPSGCSRPRAGHSASPGRRTAWTSASSA
ncbi:MAG: hypothetical protein FJW85_00085 [Actinobacteria bacterium]|nr:hypothetical protein [Actinomycetota bacterium]